MNPFYEEELELGRPRCQCYDESLEEIEEDDIFPSLPEYPDEEDYFDIKNTVEVLRDTRTLLSYHAIIKAITFHSNKNVVGSGILYDIRDKKILEYEVHHMFGISQIEYDDVYKQSYVIVLLPKDQYLTLLEKCDANNRYVRFNFVLGSSVLGLKLNSLRNIENSIFTLCNRDLILLKIPLDKKGYNWIITNTLNQEGTILIY